MLDRRVPLFLAGSSQEAMRVRKYAERLEESGLVRLTSYWFVGAEDWTGRDAERDVVEQLRISREHLTAMAQARIFWLLHPRTVSRGSYVELGVAALHPNHPYVVVSGRGSSSCIYTSLANYRDESDECGLVEVLRRAGEMVRGMEAAQ